MKSLINSLMGRGSAVPAPEGGAPSGKPAWLPEHAPVDPNNFLSFSIPVFWGTRDPERVNQLIAELLPLLAGGYHFGDNLLTWVRNISFLDDSAFRKAYEGNIQNPSDSAIAWRRYIIACAGYPCVHLEGDFVECGVYPDSFKEACPEKIAYLHIDLNNAESEIATLEALFDRVVPGGIIVFDDYEWAGIYRAQKIAEDPWLEKRRHHVFPLPTGQGLVLKRGG